MTKICRKHGISDATFYTWRLRYGGMEMSEARRLKTRYDENRRRKKLLVKAMLNVSTPCEALQKASDALGRRTAVACAISEKSYSQVEPVASAAWNRRHTSVRRPGQKMPVAHTSATYRVGPPPVSATDDCDPVAARA